MSSENESEEYFSVHGSPPPFSLRTKLIEVYERTWHDYYAWAPPRTLPLRTTVLPEIRESENIQTDSLRDVVARARDAKDKREESSGSQEIRTSFSGGHLLDKIPRVKNDISTTWIRSASVTTTSSAPSSTTTTSYWNQRKTITRPGLTSHRWICRGQYTKENISYNGSERQQFIPTFADHVVFDEDKYEALFRLKPEWEEQDRDPDIDVILLETLRRLRSEKKHGPTSISLQKINVSDAAIDATRVLPQPCNVIGSHELTRSIPAFPEQPSDEAMLNPDLRVWTSLPEVTDTESAERGAYEDWMELACPAESCGLFCCPAHVRDGTSRVMRPRQGKPHVAPLSASVAQARPSRACSEDCFVDLPKTTQQYPGDRWLVKGRNATPHWTSLEYGRLAKILERRPGDPQSNVLPCHIRLLFPSTSCAKLAKTIVKTILDGERRAQKEARVSRAMILLGAPKFKLNPAELQSTYRCTHQGPCVKGICQCADHETFCETQCMCDDACKRRFRGCSCRQSNARETCHSEKCECIKAQRECDPSVCGGCGAADVIQQLTVSPGSLNVDGAWTPTRTDTIRFKCRNVALQSGKVAKVRVDQSMVAGYGLFAEEDVEKWETIGEYVGELIPNRESNRRDMLYKVTGRNYLFDLTQDRLVDAAHVGNLTRYINGERINANCGVKIVHVLGDHRIRVFANRRIRKHEELFIDYGDAFEPHVKKKKDLVKKRTRPTPLLLAPSPALTLDKIRAKRSWTPPDSARFTDSTSTDYEAEPGTSRAKRRRFGSTLDSESDDVDFIPRNRLPATRSLMMQRSTRSGSGLSRS